MGRDVISPDHAAYFVDNRGLITWALDAGFMLRRGKLGRSVFVWLDVHLENERLVSGQCAG